MKKNKNSWDLPGFFFRFNVLIFIYFFKYKTIETHARAFLPLNISAVCSVGDLVHFKFFLKYNFFVCQDRKLKFSEAVSLKIL